MGKTIVFSNFEREEAQINVIFFLFQDMIYNAINSTPWIFEEVFQKYQGFIQVKADTHHLYIQYKWDLDKVWHIYKFQLIEEDIQVAIVEKEDDWKTPVEEEKNVENIESNGWHEEP